MPPGFKRSRALWDETKNGGIRAWVNAICYELQPIRFSKIKRKEVLGTLLSPLQSIVPLLLGIPSVCKSILSFISNRSRRDWMVVGAIFVYYWCVRWIHEWVTKFLCMLFKSWVCYICPLFKAGKAHIPSAISIRHSVITTSNVQNCISFYICRALDAGPVVLIFTALTLIFTIGLSDDENRGGLSAYSVFNKGFEQLLGSVDADSLLAQHVGGGMMMNNINQRDEEDE